MGAGGCFYQAPFVLSSDFCMGAQGCLVPAATHFPDVGLGLFRQAARDRLRARTPVRNCFLGVSYIAKVGSALKPSQCSLLSARFAGVYPRV